MKLLMDDGREVSTKNLTLDEWRLFMAEFLGRNPYASQAWDLLSCVRGPDSPSERADMDSTTHDKTYSQRRARKYNTVEVIRSAMFFGTVGGAARHHSGTSVTVPPSINQDHFDRHVVRAANILGLKIKYKQQED